MTKKLHIGTKLINAIAMTRQEYNDLRGWAVPADENPADPGYLVEYMEGGKANVPGFDGYVSWSPEEVFDRAYRSTDRMTFGDALVMLKQGKRVCREGWNGKGMWLKLVGAAEYGIAPGLLDHEQENPCNPDLLPWIGMKTADGSFVPWLASQTDVLSEDWMVVE